MTAPADVEPRRPLWQELLLSGLFTTALIAFGAAVAWVAGAFLESENGPRAFMLLAFLFVVGFLVYYAYPPLKRRWYHWAGFELCVVLGFTIPIPLVYLPWLIVTRRAWRS